jgi:predicted SnoaL-like aldol condensation-catalyzing enzyme
MVRMKRIALAGLLTVLGTGLVFGQAAPVTGVDDPAPLFTDKDPVINRNKQAAMHIVIDLLEAGHWNEADKWLTERYIQHNPLFGSGREPIVKAFGGRGPGRPIPASPKDWKTKIVAVLADKDLVAVASRAELPDPRNPGKTYTTTHFDMWRFVDGKADEHWDEGRINAPAAPAPTPK